MVAAAALSAQNPPIDAARLDIMPAILWGERRNPNICTLGGAGTRPSLIRLLFGAASDLLSDGHANSGLRRTFVIILVPLSASVYFLFRAMHSYATDVATAGMMSQTGSNPPSEVLRP